METSIYPQYQFVGDSRSGVFLFNDGTFFRGKFQNFQFISGTFYNGTKTELLKEDSKERTINEITFQKLRDRQNMNKTALIGENEINFDNKGLITNQTNNQAQIIATPTFIYTGEINNGEMSGKRTLVFNDGGIYSGTFENGRFSGKGVFFLTTGAKMEGQFMNGDFWIGTLYRTIAVQNTVLYRTITFNYSYFINIHFENIMKVKALYNVVLYLHVI
ncbi:morn_motif-containing protein [Hexamita inflata]|uniref:Morn_motif-containing protein n=1 Tax=Hexamita inflata TaxID=28002 RepID=A0ABP1HBS0_9EUKA